jgi:hypothetical protein
MASGYYLAVEWYFLKAIGLVVLAAVSMWLIWGNSVSKIKEIWDFWTGR